MLFFNFIERQRNVVNKPVVFLKFADESNLNFTHFSIIHIHFWYYILEYIKEDQPPEEECTSSKRHER